MVSQVLLNTVILCPETFGGNCFPQRDCSTEANSLYSLFVGLFFGFVCFRIEQT